MAQPMTTTDHDLHREDTDREQSAAAGSELSFPAPTPAQGRDMWRVARDSGTLDLNTSYAYLLLARDFAATSRVAIHEGEVVGFVLGYLRPTDPTCLFIWQIGVDDALRGRRVAGRMLDALVADLPQVRTLETTITEDNQASQRLFASFAERHGAQHRVGPLFEAGDFPDEGHDAELLHVIGDLRIGR